MIASKSKRIPKLRHHKATGQGFVQLDGRFVYLGRYDDPDTAEAYHRLIAEWLAGKQVAVAPDECLAVVELLAAYMDHAREYYTRADGKPRKKPGLHNTPHSYARAIRNALSAPGQIRQHRIRPNTGNTHVGHCSWNSTPSIPPQRGDGMRL